MINGKPGKPFSFQTFPTDEALVAVVKLDKRIHRITM